MLHFHLTWFWYILFETSFLQMGYKRKQPTDVCELKNFRCCSLYCPRKLEQSRLPDYRQSFMCKRDWESKRQFLLDQLTNYEQSNFRGQYNLTLNGIPICDAGWAEIFGMSLSWFNGVKKSHKKGERTAVHGNTLMSDRRIFVRDIRDETMTSFLREYMKNNCEAMPNTQQIHLPSCISFCDVYQDFMCFIGSKTVETSHLSESWFVRRIR